jgi:hypothetical protein
MQLAMETMSEVAQVSESSRTGSLHLFHLALFEHIFALLQST